MVKSPPCSSVDHGFDCSESNKGKPLVNFRSLSAALKREDNLNYLFIRKLPSATADIIGVLHVLRVGRQVHVLWINAASVVATMRHFNPSRYWPIMQLKRDNVSSNGSPVVGHSTVAVTNNRAFPWPAFFTGSAIYKAIETLKWWHGPTASLAKLFRLRRESPKVRSAGWTNFFDLNRLLLHLDSFAFNPSASRPGGNDSAVFSYVR